MASLTPQMASNECWIAELSEPIQVGPRAIGWLKLQAIYAN